jgi:hypothetical protein
MAEHVRAVLESAGIECHVANRDLRTLAGAIPIPECWPEVWIEDASQASAAERLIEELSAPRPAAEGTWRCERCGEASSDRFTSCWKCAGASELPTGRSAVRMPGIHLRAGHRRALLWMAFVLLAYGTLALLKAGTRAW